MVIVLCAGFLHCEVTTFVIENIWRKRYFKISVLILCFSSNCHPPLIGGFCPPWLVVLWGLPEGACGFLSLPLHLLIGLLPSHIYPVTALWTSYYAMDCIPMPWFILLLTFFWFGKRCASGRHLCSSGLHCQVHLVFPLPQPGISLLWCLLLENGVWKQDLGAGWACSFWGW